jgi:diadenosine tetraphosphate (Ap4A) HIT family hydrolase
MDGCLSCRIVRGEVTPTGGTILRGAHFDVHQDYACAIPGFLIVATVRHARCWDELSDDEAAEYGRLLRRLRRAQRAVLGVEHVYYFLNEDTGGHFHAWLLPRWPWMEQFGRYVESVRPILTRGRALMGDPAAVAEVARTAALIREHLAAVR